MLLLVDLQQCASSLLEIFGVCCILHTGRVRLALASIMSLVQGERIEALTSTNGPIMSHCTGYVFQHALCCGNY